VDTVADPTALRVRVVGIVPEVAGIPPEAADTTELKLLSRGCGLSHSEKGVPISMPFFVCQELVSKAGRMPDCQVQADHSRGRTCSCAPYQDQILPD
jgi:hypothetical protein